MGELTPKQIAKPGPDGTTPLMQLFANAVKHEHLASDIEALIKAFSLSKFTVKDVLEGSIHFGSKRIFQHLFALGLSIEDAKQMANLATMSEQVEILEIILEQFPMLKESCREAGINSQTTTMREFLGIQETGAAESQLVRMSRKFPKFNEDVEEIIQPLPKDATMVSIEKDIKPLLKEKFCALRCFREKPTSMPVSDWDPTKSKCHGRHER